MTVFCAKKITDLLCIFCCIFDVKLPISLYCRRQIQLLEETFAKREERYTLVLQYELYSFFVNFRECICFYVPGSSYRRVAFSTLCVDNTIFSSIFIIIYFLFVCVFI